MHIGKLCVLAADSTIDDHATKGRQALEALFSLLASDHLQDDVSPPTAVGLFHLFNPVPVIVINGDIGSQAAYQIKFVLGTGRTNHGRSEEHTSELQSQSNIVCRLLLE